MFDLIILASGIGARCELDYPKQFYKIGNKTILSYVIDIFNPINQINNIIITTIPNQSHLFIDEINKYSNIKFVEGGNTRQESVFNALKNVSSDKVIIHEAVRPFITKEHIEYIMSVNADCVVPYININTTVYSKEQSSYVDRDSLYNIQLPQLFTSDKLKKAHELARQNNNNYTDDSSLYFNELKEDITFIKGLDENIKITTKSDLELLRI
jgi:2-C-methyl-D-erythritol 4-phosphate cytidylyltransferase